MRHSVHQPRNVFLLFLGSTSGCGKGAGPGEQKAGLWGGKKVQSNLREAECVPSRECHRPCLWLATFFVGGSGGGMHVCLCVYEDGCMHAIMYVYVGAHA